MPILSVGQLTVSNVKKVAFLKCLIDLYILSFTPIEVGIFKSGIVTVQSSKLSTFNNSLLGIRIL